MFSRNAIVALAAFAAAASAQQQPQQPTRNALPNTQNGGMLPVVNSGPSGFGNVGGKDTNFLVTDNNIAGVINRIVPATLATTNPLGIFLFTEIDYLDDSKPQNTIGFNLTYVPRGKTQPVVPPTASDKAVLNSVTIAFSSAITLTGLTGSAPFNTTSNSLIVLAKDWSKPVYINAGVELVKDPNAPAPAAGANPNQIPQQYFVPSFVNISYTDNGATNSSSLLPGSDYTAQPLDLGLPKAPTGDFTNGATFKANASGSSGDGKDTKGNSASMGASPVAALSVAAAAIVGMNFF
ncbi:hypothetical protein GQ42DRAFT_153585 [Ramicandelaber brevisporus]|nr:hypothetical protein GQ42DRAFT_153585 [Ramicandelaber brevisporus]